MAQFHAQDRGLNFVKASIPSRLAADVFLRLAMVTQDAQTGGAFCRVGDDHARIAARAEIFGGIKAKASDIAERSGAATFVTCADGLRAVFDDGQMLLAGEFHDGVHVRGQAVEMNDDDGTGARSHTTLELRQVDVVSAGMNVREYRFSAKCTDGTARGHKSERGQDDFIAGRYAARAQRQYQGIGPGACADGMRSP